MFTSGHCSFLVLTGISFLLSITQVELYLLRVPLTTWQLYTFHIQTGLPAPVTQLTCTRVLTFVISSYCYSHVCRAWFSGLWNPPSPTPSRFPMGQLNLEKLAPHTEREISWGLRGPWPSAVPATCDGDSSSLLSQIWSHQAVCLSPPAHLHFMAEWLQAQMAWIVQVILLWLQSHTSKTCIYFTTDSFLYSGSNKCFCVESAWQVLVEWPSLVPAPSRSCNLSRPHWSCGAS